ncbi:cytochrome c [Chlorobium phaeovibrioides]|uniref:C-type cytochrome n=1 Tax=Chlorobium phaeovibrioides TaxID=1094 RepID=A0A3S0L2R8_CHLPH|nr:cytochrome c [Chlorobium phaeovibrioides]KAA6233177.1 cytochrome c [Chlorobium phaeovibrioides]MWV53836.1 c-type cytochrome [Chlorobium phaeovibrioides]RTY39508.1 cytochrome c [Chlorobium phaeovibrioides]
MKHTLLLAMAGLLSASLLQNADAAEPDGRAVFTRNCSVCHTINPPPKTAPPIGPIAGRYRQKFSSKTSGVASMVNFLKAPSREKSVVDPDAIERFGLMPPMPGLSDTELNAVAEWIWDQPWGGRSQGGGKGKKQQGNADCQ